jgi:hypothetical protein
VLSVRRGHDGRVEPHFGDESHVPGSKSMDGASGLNREARGNFLRFDSSSQTSD